MPLIYTRNTYGDYGNYPYVATVAHYAGWEYYHMAIHFCYAYVYYEDPVLAGIRSWHATREEALGQALVYYLNKMAVARSCAFCNLGGGYPICVRFTVPDSGGALPFRVRNGIINLNEPFILADVDRYDEMLAAGYAMSPKF